MTRKRVFRKTNGEGLLPLMVCFVLISFVLAMTKKGGLVKKDITAQAIQHKHYPTTQ